MTTQQQAHYKRLMYIDCHMMYRNGTNHNAGDRASVRSQWEYEIGKENFHEYYDLSFRRYHEIKRDPNPQVEDNDGSGPYPVNEAEIEEYATEETRRFVEYLHRRENGLPEPPPPPPPPDVREGEGLMEYLNRVGAK